MKRIIRERELTPDEAGRYEAIREQAIAEKAEVSAIIRQRRGDKIGAEGVPSSPNEVRPATCLSIYVERSPEILDGAPVFRGTRVPINALVDCLQAGDTIDDFLAEFPTVTREQAIGLLEFTKHAAVP